MTRWRKRIGTDWHAFPSGRAKRFLREPDLSICGAHHRRDMPRKWPWARAPDTACQRCLRALRAIGA